MTEQHSHVWSTELFCDEREHYFVCLRADCNARRYFCKHTAGCARQNGWLRGAR